MCLNGKLLQPKCNTATHVLISFRHEGAKLRNKICDLLKHYRTIDYMTVGLLKRESVKFSCLNCILCVLKEMLWYIFN